MITVGQARGNYIEIFRQARPSFSIICSLLIEKDSRAHQNVLILFSCACLTVITSISDKSFHFPFPLFCRIRFSYVREINSVKKKVVLILLQPNSSFIVDYRELFNIAVLKLQSCYNRGSSTSQTFVDSLFDIVT